MKNEQFCWEYEAVRLDTAVSRMLPDFSRSFVVKLIEGGCVLVNGVIVPKKHLLSSGDIVEVMIPDPVSDENAPQDIPLDIVYEDDWLLVVNKPKGLVVHPAAGNPDNTLVNALLHHCGDSLSGIGGVSRPGIVHRIDKDTSGLLMVAKTDKAHINLAQQIKEHSFDREYEAVVVGNIKDDCGEINAPIGRNPNDRKKMAVTSKNSKSALTQYRVIQRYSGYTHTRFILKTGRTHQIRVHCAHIGHPVAGDAVYGGKNQLKTKLQGQCLHAKMLRFTHPGTGDRMNFESELPEYFTQFLSKIQGSF